MLPVGRRSLSLLPTPAQRAFSPLAVWVPNRFPYGLALLKVLATPMNWAFSALPNEDAPTMIPNAMSAAIKPYSMAVAPDLSHKNLAISCMSQALDCCLQSISHFEFHRGK